MTILGLSLEPLSLTLTSALLGELFVKVERDFALKVWVGDCEGRFIKLGWLYVVYDAPSVLRRVRMA